VVFLFFQKWLTEEGKDEIPPVDCVVPLALAHSKVSGQQEINETTDEWIEDINFLPWYIDVLRRQAVGIMASFLNRSSHSLFGCQGCCRGCSSLLPLDAASPSLVVGAALTFVLYSHKKPF
jgi:hypothetical protein